MISSIFRHFPLCFGSFAFSGSQAASVGHSPVSAQSRMSSFVCPVMSIGPGSPSMMLQVTASIIVDFPLPTGVVMQMTRFELSRISFIGSLHQGVNSGRYELESVERKRETFSRHHSAGSSWVRFWTAFR